MDCLEETIRQDRDHQGLFRLCKYFGGLPLDQQTGTKRFSGMADGGEYAWGTGHKIPLDDVLALYLCIS